MANGYQFNKIGKYDTLFTWHQVNVSGYRNEYDTVYHELGKDVGASVVMFSNTENKSVIKIFVNGKNVHYQIERGMNLEQLIERAEEYMFNRV